MPNLVSIQDLNKDQIVEIFSLADHLKKHPKPYLLQGKILANCFFEPSTRTSLSFEAAMYRLGGQVLSLGDARKSSLAKGESFLDTLRVISGYCDLIVLRHPDEGASQLAQNHLSIPLLNAGDGTHEHPSQALLDLYTIYQTQKRMENLQIALVGDLKHGRTVHSLAIAAHHFDFHLHLISPRDLKMPKRIIKDLQSKNVSFSEDEDYKELLPKLDILYLTRLQKERLEKDSSLKTSWQLTATDLKKAKQNLKVLHPLPRNDEMALEVDQTPFAHYFQQAQNGLYVREALLSFLLEINGSSNKKEP